MIRQSIQNVADSVLVALRSLQHKVFFALSDGLQIIGIQEKYTFEVGGKDKSFEQIKGSKDAYVVADDLERGVGNKIPLWLFGFLY